MTALDDFIAEARAISLDVAVDKVGAIVKGTGDEKTGPCPVCGGKDRFAVNFKKGLWFCRQADRGGDALALMAYKNGHDLETRTGLVLACSDLLGRPAPEGTDEETDEERAARQARMAEAERKRAAEREAKERAQAKFREKEISQARGIWEHALEEIAGSPVSAYLAGRSGAAVEAIAGRLSKIRFSARQTYWHGQDELGHAAAIHEGPAMVAPMVNAEGLVVGCHITWIDLGNSPKLRPSLTIDGESLPTKKMRGHKKGCLIPVAGWFDAARWMVGEGIETVLAVAAVDGFRADTFYAASGDLGNMAGPADPASAFNHPGLKKPDKAGRLKPVRVAGPVPGGGIDDAFAVPPHVAELVLLADGDSEMVMTASAMARAKARLMREGIDIQIWWPPEGTDFADVLRGEMA